MKKIPCIAFFVFCFSFFLGAQDESGQYIRKGLFRSAGTFAAGAFLNSGESAIYLQGTSEYYLSERISIRGDGFYSIDLSAIEDDFTSPPLRFNHQLFSGASYHFGTSSHLDPFVGLQAGVAFTNVENIIEEGSTNTTVFDVYATNPLMSGVAGVNYYFQKWFHLFLEGRYVHGTHIARGGSIPLSELRFSFGLGWNVNFIRLNSGTQE